MVDGVSGVDVAGAVVIVNSVDMLSVDLVPVDAVLVLDDVVVPSVELCDVVDDDDENPE